MRFHFKRFLLILMMLTLPVQTFASAAMLGCAFAQPEMPMPMAMADEAMPMSCHEPAKPDAPSASHSCKHCAACYLGTALPVPVSEALPVLFVPGGVIPHFSSFFVGFIPNSPERPPRPTLG